MMRRAIYARLRLPCAQAVVAARRSVLDDDGYELPFGHSAADKARIRAVEAAKATGVQVLLPGQYRQRQWHAAGGGSAGGDDHEDLFQNLEEHAVEMRRSRVANMRMLLEGFSLLPEPVDPFNGYFQKRDGDRAPPPVLSIEEIEEILWELTQMVFPAEDEEQLHLAGSVIPEDTPLHEPDSSFSATAAKHARQDASTVKKQLISERHRGRRAPYVSDEVERKLLIALCLQTLNQRLTTTDAQKHITQRTTYIDPKTGRSPPAETSEARAHVSQYVRYGVDDNGTSMAFRVLEHVLEVEAEQQYEAIRYHAELALASGQLWRLADTFRLCRGFVEADGKKPRGTRDSAYRDACREVCEELVTNAISEYFSRGTIDQVIHGHGEGSAATWFLGTLKDVCYVVGERCSKLVLETVIDDAENTLVAAAAGGGLLGSLDSLEPLDVTHGRVPALLQSATAILKTLVGTELPLVIDDSGVLQFTCHARLYAALKQQNRTHESWGVAEHMLQFHDKFAHRLEADFQEQKRMFAESVMMMTGVDVATLEQDPEKSAPEKGILAYKERDAAVDAGPLGNGARENPYAEHMRKIHLEYLSDRTLESPIFGRKLLLRAIKERYPHSSDAWRILAMAHLKLDELDEAIAAGRTAAYLNPCDPRVHVALAAFHWGRKEFLESRRETRMAELVEKAVLAGRLITPADLEMLGSALDLVDARRKEIQDSAEDAAKEDEWSSKFFNAERAARTDALANAELNASAAMLPPITSELLKDLAQVNDKLGDEEYKDWIAHMSWTNRYSKALSRPRTPKSTFKYMDSGLDQSKSTKAIFVPPEVLEPHPPKLY
jgi:hypothetical protein